MRLVAVQRVPLDYLSATRIVEHQDGLLLCIEGDRQVDARMLRLWRVEGVKVS